MKSDWSYASCQLKKSCQAGSTGDRVLTRKGHEDQSAADSAVTPIQKQKPYGADFSQKMYPQQVSPSQRTREQHYKFLVLAGGLVAYPSTQDSHSVISNYPFSFRT